MNPTRIDIPFEKYTLANGLEVILHRDGRLPVVAVNIWYHVGPVHEAPGRAGFAHLFEHMMFQGSAHVESDQHFRLLEGAGASNVNGSTGLDRTNYLEDLPANQLELALWLEADRMGFLLARLDQSMLSNQQDVVRNERRENIENSPYGLGEEEIAHLLFPPGHPYYASIMGSHADIQSAQLEDVRAFFHRYYAPNNATLAVVGDIDVTNTKLLIERYFGTLPHGPEVEKVHVETPPITAERRVVVTDEVELPRVYMTWLTPPFYAPGDAEADLAARILGGGKASRLYHSLVYDRKIAQDVYAMQQSAELVSMFQITATARPGHTTEELEAAIEAELAAFVKSGPTDAEMASSLTVFETQLLTSIERPGGLADQLNQYNHYQGDPGYLSQDLARFHAVTSGGVRDFVATQLRRDTRTVVSVVPGPKIVPPAPATPPAPPKVTRVIESREPWRKQIPGPGPLRPAPLPVANRFTLDNGLTIYLAESHALPVVTAQLAVRAGSSADPADMHGLAGFTLAMLDEGTKTRDALTIARDMEALGTSLGSDMGRDGCSLGARVLKRNARAMLDMLAEVVLEPTFPVDEIERVRANRLTSLLQDRDEPPRIAAKVMWRDLYGALHPYGHMVIGNESALQQIRRDDLLRFYQAHFRPDVAALVLTGDLTEAEARTLAEETFGRWRAASTAKATSWPTVKPAAERVLIAHKPNTPQTTLMVAQIGTPRSHPDYEQLDVMNQVLGGLFSSRINMNLREKHGYTYGAFSSLHENREGGPFTIVTSVRADVTGDSVRQILKEVEGMLSAPVTAAELRSAKESITRTLPAYFQSTASAAATFGQLYLLGLPPDYYQGLPERIESLTAEQIAEVTREHLRLHDLKVIAVGDREGFEAQLLELELGSVGHRDLEGEALPVDGQGTPAER